LVDLAIRMSAKVPQ